MALRGDAEIGMQRIRGEEDRRQRAGKFTQHRSSQKKSSQDRERGEDRVHQKDCRRAAEFVGKRTQGRIAEGIFSVIIPVVREHIVAADKLVRVIQDFSRVPLRREALGGNQVAVFVDPFIGRDVIAR